MQKASHSGPGAGGTVFLLFFGISLLEALRSGNWIHVLFWITMGGLFLMMDRGRSS